MSNPLNLIFGSSSFCGELRQRAYTIKASKELASGGAQHPDLSLRGALATWQSLEKQAKEIASLRSQ